VSVIEHDPEKLLDVAEPQLAARYAAT